MAVRPRPSVPVTRNVPYTVVPGVGTLALKFVDAELGKRADPEVRAQLQVTLPDAPEALAVVLPVETPVVSAKPETPEGEGETLNGAGAEPVFDQFTVKLSPAAPQAKSSAGGDRRAGPPGLVYAPPIEPLQQGSELG